MIDAGPDAVPVVDQGERPDRFLPMAKGGIADMNAGSASTGHHIPRADFVESSSPDDRYPKSTCTIATTRIFTLSSHDGWTGMELHRAYGQRVRGVHGGWGLLILMVHLIYREERKGKVVFQWAGAMFRDFEGGGMWDCNIRESGNECEGRDNCCVPILGLCLYRRVMRVGDGLVCVLLLEVNHVFLLSALACLAERRPVPPLARHVRTAKRGKVPRKVEKESEHGNLGGGIGSRKASILSSLSIEPCQPAT